MRFNDYGAAALGITRRGTEDGQVLRTISMAGFAGFGAPPPATKADFTTYAASNWLDEGCLRSGKRADGTSIAAPASSFCQCMYGEADRISTANKNSSDFRNGSPRWACQIAAEYNFPPWTDDSLLLQVVASGGKADPLKSLPLAEKVAAYKAIIQNVGEKEIGLPGIASFKLKEAAGVLEQVGAVPKGTFAAASTALNIDAYRGQVRARSDKDLVALIAQFQQNPPDPATNTENAAMYAAAIEENNFRAANPCPPNMQRTVRFGLDADGRAKCDQVSVRPLTGGRPDALFLTQIQMPPNLLIGGGGAGGGGSSKPGASAMPTGLLIGGAIAAAAAIFLLKK